MIISRTPYRVSFAGGGTDLPAFYREEPGAVLSVAIRKHVHVTVHQRFEPNTRVAYSRTETVEDFRHLEHELVREAIRLTGVRDHLEVTTIGDVPAGTGMGSSSSLTAGLLTALYAYRGRVVSPAQIAREACRIEIDVLGKPIGKQDQYAAAFGGLNLIHFQPDETVQVEPVVCRPATLRKLERRILMVYTGRTRSADNILRTQSAATAINRSLLRQMRELALAMRDCLTGQADLEQFAALLHEGWMLKRSQGCGISDSAIDNWYETARKAGAEGGKLLGAGGGGFLLLMAAPQKHAAILQALGNPRTLDFAIEPQGSHCLFVDQFAAPAAVQRTIRPIHSYLQLAEV